MSSPFNLKNITTLHVEFTSKCNLLCLQCARTDGDSRLSTLPMADLNPIFLNKVLTEFEALGNPIVDVHACGNYGDFSMCQNFFEHLDVLKSKKIQELRLYSNGSGRSKEFWSEVASKAKGFATVTFSLDGLEDTNHIYRKGSNWAAIMKNVEAYIEHGGDAIWEMLVFKHNEHQVEEARALAKRMGFKSFRLKYPNRFESAPRDELQKTSLSSSVSIPLEVISCKYASQNWMYLSFEGDLFPCCWMAGRKYKSHQKGNEIWNLFERYGPGFLNIGSSSLDELMSHPFYAEELNNRWSSNPWKVCSGKCKGDSENKENKYKQLF